MSLLIRRAANVDYESQIHDMIIAAINPGISILASYTGIFIVFPYSLASLVFNRSKIALGSYSGANSFAAL